MNNENLVPFLHRVFEHQIAHVKILDQAGLSFNNIIQELQGKFALSFIEAKIVLMLCFPHYH